MIRLLELFCQKWNWTVVKHMKPNFLHYERPSPLRQKMP